jgi:drug/metabolite transporter (DMT)-like permease
VKRHPGAELALAGNSLIWGATFVLVKRALEDASTLLFLGVRFSIAAAVLAVVYRRRLAEAAAPARAGVLAGVFLFGGYALQTAGLRLTSATKTAFITGLFTVMVPLLSAAVYRAWPHLSEMLGALVATAGMSLLTLEGDWSSLGRMAWGDVLVFLGALSFAAHAVVLGHYTRQGGFERLSVLQIAVSAGMALTLYRWLETPHFHSTPALWVALLVTSLLATALAFTVMAWSMQYLSPSRAALIFALEPVFAWMTWYLVSGESLAPRAAAGAALILGGILVVELKPVGSGRHPSL